MVLPNPVQYTGTIRTNIDDMEIGDVIGCTYSRSKDFKTVEMGSFTDIGRSLTESDTEFNIRLATPVYSGGMFLTKVAPGILITNNVVMANIRWIDMARAGLVYGKIANFGGREFLVRLPKFKEYLVVCSGLNGKLSFTKDAIYKFLRAESISGTKILASYYNDFCQDNGYSKISGISLNAYDIDTRNEPYYDPTASNFNYRFALIYKENPKCTDFWH